MTDTGRTIKLNAGARPFVLYQRTELLPERNNSLLNRIKRKLGLSESYESFVAAFAVSHAREIDEAYSKVMRE